MMNDFFMLEGIFPLEIKFLMHFHDSMAPYLYVLSFLTG